MQNIPIQTTKKINNNTYNKVVPCKSTLRTVPTFVTAHTFCASRDTRVSYGWCLLNKGIFLCGLKLCGESRTCQMLLVSKKKIWGNHAFFRSNKASTWKKKPYNAFYFAVFLNNCCLINYCLITSKKCVVPPPPPPPIFLLDFNSPCFPRIVINYTKILLY